MKIAILGYGKMGKEIEKIALQEKHDIVSIIDKKKLFGDIAKHKLFQVVPAVGKATLTVVESSIV